MEKTTVNFDFHNMALSMMETGVLSLVFVLWRTRAETFTDIIKTNTKTANTFLFIKIPPIFLSFADINFSLIFAISTIKILSHIFHYSV